MNFRKKLLRWERYQSRCEQLAGAPRWHILLPGWRRMVTHDLRRAGRRERIAREGR